MRGARAQAASEQALGVSTEMGRPDARCGAVEERGQEDSKLSAGRVQTLHLQASGSCSVARLRLLYLRLC